MIVQLVCMCMCVCARFSAFSDLLLSFFQCHMWWICTAHTQKHTYIHTYSLSISHSLTNTYILFKSLPRVKNKKECLLEAVANKKKKAGYGNRHFKRFAILSIKIQSSQVIHATATSLQPLWRRVRSNRLYDFALIAELRFFHQFLPSARPSGRWKSHQLHHQKRRSVIRPARRESQCVCWLRVTIIFRLVMCEWLRSG